MFGLRGRRAAPPAGSGGPLKAPLYLVSMSSFPNYGDELIAARWLEHLARHRPDDEVWLDCRHPGTANALFGDLHPRLRVTDAVFRAVDDSLRGSRRSIEDIVTNLGTPLYDAPLLALREAHSLHLLGGGFVNSVWPENDLVVRAMRAAATVSGAHLVATGQGLAPFGTELLHGFDHVSVRDAPSAEKLGIAPGVDDAYLVEELPGRERTGPPELVLCVQSDAIEDGAFEQLLGYVRRAAGTLGIPASAPGTSRRSREGTMQATTGCGTWSPRTASCRSPRCGEGTSSPRRIRSGSPRGSTTTWSPRCTVRGASH